MQEISESGYSSEKASAISSPVFLDNSLPNGLSEGATSDLDVQFSNGNDSSNSTKVYNYSDTSPMDISMTDSSQAKETENSVGSENENGLGLDLGWSHPMVSPMSSPRTLKDKEELDLKNNDSSTDKIDLDCREKTSMDDIDEKNFSKVQNLKNDFTKQFKEVKEKVDDFYFAFAMAKRLENPVGSENGNDLVSLETKVKEFVESADEIYSMLSQEESNNGKNSNEVQFFGKALSEKIKEVKEKEDEINSEKNGVLDMCSNIEKLKIEKEVSAYSQREYYQTKEGESSIQTSLNQFAVLESMSGNNKIGCENCTKRENKVGLKILKCTESYANN